VDFLLYNVGADRQIKRLSVKCQRKVCLLLNRCLVADGFYTAIDYWPVGRPHLYMLSLPAVEPMGAGTALVALMGSASFNVGDPHTAISLGVVNWYVSGGVWHLKG
jgi:hypothetical protein